MSNELNQRAMHIFDDVCDLPPDQQAAAIDKACRDDATLHAAVMRLVKHDVAVRTKFARGLGAELLATDVVGEANDKIPEQIGRYRIVREIGRGGMGVVYEAEQADPKRRVALKIIRESLASRELQQRFRRESHLLGQLQHPGIAHIYEAGTEQLAGGTTPYFAMEYIEGEPLDVHVRAQKPELQTILELFIRICDAVNHAHQKGIIHRDLKPGNVLVKRETTSLSEGSQGTAGTDTFIDAIGQPKILDFGVARISGSDFHATLQTHVGQIVGTLAYMSPEQMDGDPADIDIRCDVYAIGVMLYQILAGRMPIDISGKPLAEAARLIRESDPKLLGSVDPSFRGDIETIVATAMEPDRSRRYASAAALAEDLRRYIAREPIAARPASAMYQLTKFASRNKAVVAGVVTSFVILLMGIIGTTIGLNSALKANAELKDVIAEKDQANADLERANLDLETLTENLQAVVSFQKSRITDINLKTMGTGLREWMIANVADEQRTALSEILKPVNFTDASKAALRTNLFESTIAAIDREFTDDPVTRADLLLSTAISMYELGIYDLALTSAERAHTFRAEALGENHIDTAEALSHVGRLQNRLGNYEASLETWQRVEAKILSNADDHHKNLMYARNGIAAALGKLGRLQESAEIHQSVLENRTERLGADHELTHGSRYNLATALERIGRVKEAIDLYQTALDGRRRILGNEHPETLSVMTSLAGALESLGRVKEAEKLLRECVTTSRKTNGNKHPDTLSAINSLASVMERMGALEEAEALYLESMTGNREVLGDRHPTALYATSNYGYILSILGRTDEAEPYYREVLSGFRETRGPEHPSTLVAMNNLAALLLGVGKVDESFQLYETALEARRRTLGPTHPSTLNSTYNMGNMLYLQGKIAEAEPFVLFAFKEYRKLGENHIGYLYSLGNLGSLRYYQGRYAEAEELFRDQLNRRTAMSGPTHPETIESRNMLCKSLERQERYHDAEALRRDWLATLNKEVANAPDHRLYADYSQALLNLGACLILQQQYSEAEQLIRDARNTFKEKAPNGFKKYYSMCLLGEALAGLDRCSEARPLLTEGAAGVLERLEELNKVDRPRTRSEAERRSALCDID